MSVLYLKVSWQAIIVFTLQVFVLFKGICDADRMREQACGDKIGDDAMKDGFGDLEDYYGRRLLHLFHIILQRY